MKTMTFDVTTRVTVRIDETKFTQELMAQFNNAISDFGIDEDAFELHGEHIARLAAEGEDFWPGGFVEGYGIVRDAGIKVEVANERDIERVDGSLRATAA